MKRKLNLFLLGGAGYIVIELLWRGRTHPTMFFAGGLSFLCFSLISEYFKNKNIFVKAILCSAAVSLIELVFGIVFNIGFGMEIWDYSDRAFNLLGQICPFFSLLWAVLSIFAMPLADYLNGVIVDR